MAATGRRIVTENKQNLLLLGHICKWTSAECDIFLCLKTVRSPNINTSGPHCTRSILYVTVICVMTRCISLHVDIYGSASHLTLLTTPTPFNLTAVILMTMALAKC